MGRTIHGIERTVKLSQHVITNKVNHPALILMHKGGHFIAIGRQHANGCHLILGHESTVSDHIGAQKRSESVFDITGSHLKNSFDKRILPYPRNANRHS